MQNKTKQNNQYSKIYIKKLKMKQRLTYKMKNYKYLKMKKDKLFMIEKSVISFFFLNI